MGAPKDAYEARFIDTPGAIIHRDKNVAKTAVLAMLPMAIIALLATIMVALGADPAAPRALAIVPGIWFAWTAYMMLTKVSVRTVLTHEMLEVHWGMSRTRVPVAAITSCKVQTFDGALPQASFATKMWGPKGWVEVHWTDENGKAKAAQFPANDPATLVAHIQRREGLRIADVADADEDVLAEVEAESAAKRSRS